MSSTNKERAARGRAAVIAGSEQGCDQKERVIDSLANIMHFCYQEKLDFNALLRTADMHYIAERPHR